MSRRINEDVFRPETEFKKLRLLSGLSQQDFAVQVKKSVRTIQRYEEGELKPHPLVMEEARLLAKPASQEVTTSPSAFTFIDLFAGIGGMRLGFEAVGGRCVFTSEWDPYAQITYRANFGELHPIAGDIRKVEATEIPQFDVLLAGFPCQPFSIAGVSKKNALGRPHGFEDETQGTLFYDIARIIKARRPKAFLLENVKNLASHDKGNTFRVIRDVLTRDLGYRIHWKVLDAQHWVPQHRERVFIVGFREEVPFDWGDALIPNIGPRLNSILHGVGNRTEVEAPYTDDEGSPAEKYILSQHLWRYLKNYAAKHKAKGNGFGYGLCTEQSVARTLSARYYKDGSEILISRGRKVPRRLTPRECARLMGFDRPGRSNFRIPVSDTRAYKQFGNAVVVPVVEAIAEAMFPHIASSADATRQLRLALAAS